MEERVIQLIKETTKINTGINSDTNFVDDLNLDSLDIVSLMMKMEEEFNVEIPEEDAGELRCVSDVVSYLQKKQ